MAAEYIFISYSTHDSEFVRSLCQSLEDAGISVWVDSHNMRGGSKLAQEIAEAICRASHTIVVLSPNTVNSPWMREEIALALKVEKEKNSGYRVIPILLPGIEPTALDLWFHEQPLALPISLEPGALQAAMPDIMAALGKELPAWYKDTTIVVKPCADLVLELENPEIKTQEGETRACGIGHLVFSPPAPGARKVTSKRFAFRSPVGPIEFQEIRWYLEEYFRWPVGVFRKRAKKVEETLTKVGKALYDAVFHQPEAVNALHAWKGSREICATLGENLGKIPRFSTCSTCVGPYLYLDYNIISGRQELFRFLVLGCGP